MQPFSGWMLLQFCNLCKVVKINYPSCHVLFFLTCEENETGKVCCKRAITRASKDHEIRSPYLFNNLCCMPDPRSSRKTIFIIFIPYVYMPNIYSRLQWSRPQSILIVPTARSRYQTTLHRNAVIKFFCLRIPFFL